MTSRLHVFVGVTAALLLSACSADQPEPAASEAAPQHEVPSRPSASTPAVEARPIEPPEWALTSEEYAALPATMEPQRPIQIHDYDDGNCVVLPGGLLHKQEIQSAAEFATLPAGNFSLNIKLRYETINPYTIEHAYLGGEYYPECNDEKIVYLGDYMLEGELLKGS